MSTTFEVYPGNSSIPSFHEVEREANGMIEAFFKQSGIGPAVRFHLELVRHKAHEVQPIEPHQPFRWEDSHYVRFYVPGSEGAAFGDFDAVDELTRDYLISEIAQKGVVNEWYAPINESLRLGYSWTFTRKWGQPALVSVGYGFLAAAVARLTGGFLYSSDGAWEYARFPAWPDAFVASYLQPAATQDPTARDTALWCLQWLGEEIRKI